MELRLPDARSVTGVVLAGGQGRRVGGADKGLLEVGGRPLAEQVVANLRAHCASVLVSANRNAERYGQFADDVVADARAGFLGPLAGLEAAMQAVSTPLLLVSPCDMPDVPAALYRGLLAELMADPSVQLTVADDGERVQPLVCAVRRSSLAELSRYLDGGGRAAYGWLDVTPHVRVAHELPGGLRNWNRL